MNPLRCQTCWPCRRRASTGCSATSAGSSGSPTPWRRAHRRAGPLRPGGDLRGDLPDRGLLRVDVAVLQRPPLRGDPQVHRVVQGARPDLRRPAVRHGGVHEHQHRRDQEPDGLHGRLPLDDRARHLHHQRDRAGRGVPAGPQPGRLLRAHPRQDVRQGHLHRPDHPEPGRLAGVRDRQARHDRRAGRPQAQAVGDRAAQGAGLEQRPDPRGLRRLRVDAGHPGEGPHPGPGRRAAGHLPQAAPGRAADQGGGADPAGQPLLQRQALRPGQGRPVQAEQEAGRRSTPVGLDAVHRRHRRHDQVPRGAARRGVCRRRASATASTSSFPSRSTTSTTSATGACAALAS